VNLSSGKEKRVSEKATGNNKKSSQGREVILVVLTCAFYVFCCVELKGLSHAGF
jgi:hypothetical protein